MVAFFVLTLLLLHREAASLTATVKIGAKTLRKISPYYVGVTMDTAWILNRYCNINFERAIKLGQEITPGYLRVGGTMADYFIFDPSAPPNTTVPKICNVFPPNNNFTMTKSDIDTVVYFARSTGWRLIFDFNGLLRDASGMWSSKNAKMMLDYMNLMEYDMDFQLGNEPDLKKEFKANNSGWVLAQNYKKFRLLLNQYPRYRKSKLIGPAMAGGWKTLLKHYLQNGATKYTDAVTFHHYYGDGRSAKIESFLSPHTMNSVHWENRDPIIWTKNYSKNPNEEVWLGETSTFYHGGAPNLSDRYVAGFLWLDKLGISAQMGLDVVLRQTFFLSNYALVDMATNPNPDYFLTVLFKRLQGDQVLPVNVSSSVPNATDYLRFYAHCNASHTIAYGMNLWPNSSEVRIKIDTAPGKVWQYLFEPTDGNLTSKTVELNGNPMNFDHDLLTPMVPKLIEQPISVPRYRYGFYVFPGGCKEGLLRIKKPQ